MTAIRTRFAPSPTGFLHAGNARIALVNYLFARRHGGQFILRIDDTDTARSQPQFEEAIRQDLRWLGLDWDESFRQSERLDLYNAAAERLERSGRLYPCFESEEELAAKREQQIRRGRPPVYDRAMLKLTPEQRRAAEAKGKRPYWRFLLSDGELGWEDLILGAQRVKLGSLSDPVLVREDGTPLYTFTSVVDDLDTEITHVIRGADHVTNTAVQLDLLAALRGDPARIRFGHLPLLMDATGGKLSKRLDAISLRKLRSDGIEPDALASYLARVGTSDDIEPMSMEELVESFDLEKFSRAATRFDPRQLLALNHKVLRERPYSAVAERLPQGATEAFWLAVRGNLELLSEARGWWDVVGGTIIPPVFEDPEERELLRTALELLPPEPWGEDVWTVWTNKVREATGRSGRQLFLPLRLALTGEDHGPELKALLPLMGHARTAQRLEAAAG
jgi:glutamyl-tRNA synthetase